MKQLVRFLKKPYRWAAVYATVLSLFFTFVLLDAFVVPHAQMRVTANSPEAQAVPEISERDIPKTSVASASSEASVESVKEQSKTVTEADPVVTASSYEDENIQITVETVRKYNTTFYVADIRLSDASFLKTALAQNTFGRNIKDTTSNMAEENNAILAINGDYYGFRDTGWVLRNGVLYRETSNGVDALVIDTGGNFSIVKEDNAGAVSFPDAWQVFSFGPALVNGGAIAVSENSEISGKSSNSNPRTAIGQAGDLHYIVIVSDGRTGDDAGLSLYQLAQEFTERGCTVAYNLDGGGSTTMIMNGEIVNNPVGGKRSSGTERKVSDIVYIGYE